MSTYYPHKMERATGWRIRLKNQLMRDIVNKCDNKWDWFDPTVNFEENYNAVNNKTVLRQNDYYLNQSDIMVVCINDLEKSPGTIYEIIDFGKKGKPVIAFGQSEWIKSPHISEFITAHLKEDKIMAYLDAMYYQ